MCSIGTRSFSRQRRRLYHVATSAITAHAMTAPIVGPAIHALEGSAWGELVSTTETALVAVADGREIEAMCHD